MQTFDEYQEERDRLLTELNVYLSAETHVPHLERIALKCNWLFRTGRMPFPEGTHGDVLALLALRTMHELLAFCATLRVGALDAAWHHLRAQYELAAAIHYLFGTEALTPKRVEQFMEYEKMYPWLTLQRFQELLRTKKISQEVFDERRVLLTEEHLRHATQERVALWLDLYGEKKVKDLTSRPSWHEGSIAKLVRTMNPNGSLNAKYETLCHGTHISPFGHRFSSADGHPRFIFEPAAGRLAAAEMLIHSWVTIDQIDQALGGRLLPQLATEVLAAKKLQVSPVMNP